MLKPYMKSPRDICVGDFLRVGRFVAEIHCIDQVVMSSMSSYTFILDKEISDPITINVLNDQKIRVFCEVTG